MAMTEIIQFHTETPACNADLQKALKALQDNGTPGHFAIGTLIQDPHTVQVTAELHNSNNHQTGTQTSSIAPSLRSLFGDPTYTSHIPFPSPVFKPNGPATAPVIEYVQSFFPLSRLTPTFQQKIEADFNNFNTILNSDGPHQGRGSLTYGWSEPVSHPDISGEKARAFTVTCGWESMGEFEAGLKTEAFGRAIPVLYAWGAAYRMVRFSLCSFVSDEVGGADLW